MDTVEELRGTYFYGGLHNLTAGELYFWIFVDITAEHFNITWKATARYNTIARGSDKLW
jgi:hypothetical protein